MHFFPVFRLSPIVLIILPGVFSTLDLPAAEPLRVGMAAVDITPPVGYRTGGGYGEVISTGVTDPLFARALVLRQGSTAAAIVISDLLSVPPDLSAEARRRAGERTGIPASNIVVAATHDHGSPEYWGPLRDIAHEAAVEKHGRDPHEKVDYPARLVTAWVEALVRASERASPCTVHLEVAHQTSLAFNRRFHLRDGSVRFNPGALNPDIVRPAGPVDPELPVLLFRRDDEKRSPLGLLVTFALHTAVHGGTTFSGDFPAVLESRLREELGPDLISIFAEGCAGDLNHIDVSRGDQLRGRAEVERIGETLATTVLRALETAKPLERLDLAVVSRTAHAPFQPVSEERIREARRQLRDQKENGLPFLRLVEAWRDCHRYRYSRLHDGGKPLEVQAIRLNADTAIVTLPHEVFVEIGMAIRATSPFRHTVVISLANDIDFYIPTRRAFEEGSYEVTTCPLDPGCGELLLDTAREALVELKRS